MLKTLIRFDGRHVCVLLIGSVIGGIIGALGGYLATHSLYYAQSDWAAVWTMRWNAALVFAAVLSFAAAFVAAVYAKRGVDTVIMTERLKRTEEQIMRFDSPIIEAAFDAQVVPQHGIVAQQGIVRARLSNKEDRDQMADVVNYLSWVVNLAERHLIDEHMYFDRHGPSIILTYVVLTPYLDTLREKGLADIQDFRAFAVRAYRYMLRSGFQYIYLAELTLNLATGDVVAKRDQ